MKRVKILQLQPDYNVKKYDIADLAEQIVKSFPADRFEVVSAYLCGKPAPGEPETCAERAHYFELSERDTKGLRLGALRKLHDFCRAEAFDVVICNRFKTISMMLILNKWLHVPLCIAVVHGLHDYDRSYRRLQVRLLADRAWRFVGVSPAVSAKLIAYKSGFRSNNTVAITNAIDIEQAVSLQYPRSEARRLLGLDGSARLIGALGRLVPVKGHVHLIQAFARVAGNHPNAQVAIIGEGRARPLLEEEIRRHGLEGRVHLLGAKPDALQYVRAFDIWAMPSLSEGLGLALMEGMSGELPIIASDIPAMSPLIRGAGGHAVAPGDVEGLSRALDDYLGKSHDELRALGSKAFAYLCECHDLATYRKSYLSLVEKTCE